MTKALYIESLHRPYNQQLKTARWVCEFVASSKKKISSRDLVSEFYYHLIGLLHKEYSKSIPDNFNGLPSNTAITSIAEYLSARDKKGFLEELPLILKSRDTSTDKQIYSVYKAASYYVTLAKGKFKLIDDKNRLTDKGAELLKLRSGFFKISTKEADFYFERILEADFHLFVSNCLFMRLANKYNLKNTVSEQAEFITEYLKIKHFNFTTASLSNYNVVRNSWIDSLNIIDANGNIRKRFVDIINNDEIYKTWFNELKDLVKTFENENFKARTAYNERLKNFLLHYNKKATKNINDQGFVNLHDIKKEMRISPENFQKFIVQFYESEKKRYSIFFNNIVNSIDTRERFYIRNRPVIKIKLKKNENR